MGTVQCTVNLCAPGARRAAVASTGFIPMGPRGPMPAMSPVMPGKNLVISVCAGTVTLIAIVTFSPGATSNCGSPAGPSARLSGTPAPARSPSPPTAAAAASPAKPLVLA